ncbi:MAG TPA: hypothetical protein VMK84_15550 [Streptosporangiaceae bacterium]|nr:hypothetical protein [Streptosporangiaceae bacterium]
MGRTLAQGTDITPGHTPATGSTFQAGPALSTLTPGLGDGLVGTTGPVTAQQLGQLGARSTGRPSRSSSTPG